MKRRDGRADWLTPACRAVTNPDPMVIFAMTHAAKWSFYRAGGACTSYCWHRDIAECGGDVGGVHGLFWKR